MKDFVWEINPAAVLVFALIYFFDESGLVALMLPPVLIHELGHFSFMRLGGLRVRKLSLGMFGLEMDYWGELRGCLGAAAILAGPLFGLLYAVCGLLSPYEYLRQSGGVSLLLSLFNLLPVLPLDGGRLGSLLLGEAFTKISRVISFFLAAAALVLWISKGWISLFAIALWLVWANNKNRG